MSEIPYMIIVPIVVMAFLGSFIDKAMSNEIPVFMLIGFFTGVILGFMSIYKKYGK